MTRVNLVQTNLTAGEVSPRMLGRVDVERYKNGVQECYNFLPLIHGGARSSPALMFRAAAKYSDKKCRLIRFEFSKTEANMLEFGEEYIRFFDLTGAPVLDSGSPYEITTVYQESELFEIEYVGGADTIFLFHENHPIQRLRRFAADRWVIDEAPLSPAPFDEQGHSPNATLTLSASTVGTGRTFTAGSSSFLPGDVGRRIVNNGGTALITAYSSATEVTCTVEIAFNDTSIAAGAWTITGSPQAIATPSEAPNIGEEITILLSTSAIYEAKKTLTDADYLGSDGGRLQFTTAANHGYSIGNIVRISGCEPFEYNGTYKTKTDFPDPPDADKILVSYDSNPGSIVKLGTVQRIQSTATADGFRSEDVGSFISINGGLVEITALNSAAEIAGVVRQSLSSDATAVAGSWTILSPIWSEANGYPRTGTFFQQRLIAGGSPTYPHTLAASRTGEYLSFEIGLDDDAAFLYDLDVTEYDPILHLTRIKNQLIALTSGNEFTLTGGIETPIAPLNVQVDNPTDYGCNDVRPIRVGNELLFVNRTGRKVRAMGYQFERDSFASPDLTKLSEHITGTGLLDIAYQQESESIVWAVRDDGVMVTMSIDRDEGVVAWARQITPNGGIFESVEVIPNEDGLDEVWCVVKRTIDGGVVRYIEAYDEAILVNLHSAVYQSSETATDTWANLDHLEGETVEIIADGAVMEMQEVVGGEVTLERDAYETTIGLPARGYIKTLNPEFVSQIGSVQGRNIRIIETTARVLDTVAMLINGQYVDLRAFGSGLLDAPPPPFTGDVSLTKLGWGKNTFITIEQANALPIHILAFIMRVESN